MFKKLLLSTVLGLTLLCQTTDSFAWDWPIIDSQNPNHHIVINKFIANAKNERSTFQYIGHQFKTRGGNNQYTAKNSELYRKADELNRAFLSGKRIQIKPTSSYDVYSEFTEKCLYKILINGTPIIEGFRVYNADADIVQAQQVNRNNNDPIIVSQNNNNNLAPQQPRRVNPNVNVANVQNAFNFDNCGLNAGKVEKAKTAFHQFKNAGDLSVEAKIVGIQRVSSFEVDFIVFVEDKGIQKVIKIMIGRNAGHDKDFFEADLNLVNQINQLADRNNVSIPKLIVSDAMLDGNGLGAYLQEKAKGKLLVGFDIKKMSDNDVKTMFKSIGKQSGNLDQLLIDNNMPFIHHTDSHSKNLFFDAQTQQFSWIDTAGLAHDYDQRQVTTSPEEGSLFTIKVINTFINNPIMSNEANQEQGPDAGNSIAILNAEEEAFNRYYHNINAQKINKLKNAIRNGGSYDYSLEATKADIETILSSSKKFAIALKSLGEGYVRGNPSAKSFVNTLLKNSEVAQYLKYANDLRALIGKPAEPVFDLSIR